MLIEGIDPFATAKPDARLIKLLIRARRFNAELAASDGVPFATLVKHEGVSPSYFTRLVRLSYLAPDIKQAILDERPPARSDRGQAAGALTSAAHPSNEGCSASLDRLSHQLRGVARAATPMLPSRLGVAG